MSSVKTEAEFRKWLFEGIVALPDEQQRRQFALLMAPFFCAPPSAGGILNAAPDDEDENEVDEPPTTSDEIEDGAVEALRPSLPMMLDESTRHSETGSAGPQPALKPVPPGLRKPRAAAVLTTISAGWDGDLGKMAKAVYGRNSPHNRRRSRSMVHSLRSRGRIEYTPTAGWALSKTKAEKKAEKRQN